MKKISSTLLAAALLFTGCQDWLDINTNPNYLPETDYSLLMPSAEMRLAEKVGYDLALYGHFWSQYVNQNASTNQYYTVSTFDVTNSTFASVWSYLYSGVLPGVREVKEKAAQDPDGQEYLFEASILESYSFYLLTSLYDSVAYNEGYIKESFEPHFDSGEAMQTILINNLKAIREMDFAEITASAAKHKTAATDMIFNHDVDAWLRFANTLYLKVLMRDFTANQTEIQTLLTENKFLNKKDAAFDHFKDEADKSNPFYESDRRQLNTALNIRACSDILNVLDSNDPRIEYYYENSHGATAFGTAYGVTVKPAASWRLNLEPTTPVYFSTVDEAEFLKAEAYARLNDPVSAETAYKAALAAAFKRVDCDPDTLIAKTYKFDATATAEGMVEQIINQKWASNVKGMAIESWFDLSRTGYPTRGTTITAFSGVLGSGKFPYRFINSKTSADYNPNSPKAVEVYEKMWWQK